MVDSSGLSLYRASIFMLHREEALQQLCMEVARAAMQSRGGVQCAVWDRAAPPLTPGWDCAKRSLPRPACLRTESHKMLGDGCEMDHFSAAAQRSWRALVSSFLTDYRPPIKSRVSSSPLSVTPRRCTVVATCTCNASRDRQYRSVEHSRKPQCVDQQGTYVYSRNLTML